MSSFASVVNAFGEHLGIAGLALDAQGCCRLVFDGQRMLELRASSAQRRLILSVGLGGAGDFASNGIERLLLRANLWGAGASGGWFAIDEKERICLQQEVALGDESAALMIAKIEGMLNGVELWEKKISASSSAFMSPEAVAMARMSQKV